MSLVSRFERAKVITASYLENGNYLRHPSTKAGWILRIACTDVGQGAWQKAKSEEVTQNCEVETEPRVEAPESS